MSLARSPRSSFPSGLRPTGSLRPCWCAPRPPAREATELDHRADILALCLHADGVLVGAGNHVDRSANQRLQGLRAAAEIIDGDVEPLLLEIAEALADGQRQVIERILATHAKRDLVFLQCLATRHARQRKQNGKRSQQGHPQFHGLLLPHGYLCLTASDIHATAVGWAKSSAVCFPRGP